MVKINGTTFPSFTATSGVRQGCPLSPVLFVAVVDVLLRKLRALLPDAITKAFADDTAMVVPNFHWHANTIMSLFKEFGEISGLHLNLPKTVLIPLWPSTPQRVKRMLCDDFPMWRDVCVSYFARYLGFLVGPDAWKT